MPFSPLGRAILTGRRTDATALGNAGMRPQMPRFQGTNFAHNPMLVENFAAIAAEAGQVLGRVVFMHEAARQRRCCQHQHADDHRNPREKPGRLDVDRQRIGADDDRARRFRDIRPGCDQSFANRMMKAELNAWNCETWIENPNNCLSVDRKHQPPLRRSG